MPDPEAHCKAPGSGKALTEELPDREATPWGAYASSTRVTEDRPVEVVVTGTRKRIDEETHLLVRRSAG